jgi:NAD(P)-dependent dehydrogenase (short-subunit alcohol dehydrogenase family)
MVSARAKVASKNPATATISLTTEIRDAEERVLVSGVGRVKLRGPSAYAAETTQPAIFHAEGPVAIVTGGVRGIGGAIARRLVRAGYDVVAAFRSNEAAAHAQTAAITRLGGRFRAVRADITREEDLDRLVSAAGAAGRPVRVLVNAAIGELVTVAADELQWREFGDHLDTQVKGVFNLARRVHPLMKAAGGGAIVNLLSQVVNNAPPKGMAHYVTAKYALMGLSKALAAEWASDNIRVNMISPGLARTELTQGYSDRVFTMERIKTPLRRLVEPSDVAEAAAFLVGEDAGFITGINLLLTGGQDMP